MTKRQTFAGEAQISTMRDSGMKMNTETTNTVLGRPATRSTSRWTSCLLALLLALLAVTGRAQTSNATLTGFVADQTNAVIPGAKVTLVNQQSKDMRVTMANSSGYFTFTAVPTGTYTVKVEYQGFDTFVEKDIALHPQDSRELTNIKLKIGTINTAVTVKSASSAIDATGERSALITAEDIKRLPVEGRDVTELIKTLPGFAMIGGGGASGTGADNQGPNAETAGSQTGSYAANGVSPEGMTIISDGVNVTDPGNGASSDQVINMDNVAEVKIQTSNFGADSAKGPIVINAVGKSGGSEYHGSLYTYLRTHQLNSQDAFSKAEGDSKPDDHYVYPGFNIGGPLRIPGTNFNHNKKLTFFAGAEDYIQRNIYAYGSADSATINALVPTAAMRGGDFSSTALSEYFGVTDDSTTCQNQSQAKLVLYVSVCGVPSGELPAQNGSPLPQHGPTIQDGHIPTSSFDPNTQAIINNLIPLPNHTPFESNPSGQDTGIYNYQQINLLNNDSVQARVRVDYAISDSSKLYVTYNYQHGTGRNPQQIFYSPQQPFGEVNTPGGILNGDNAHVISANFTQVLSSSMTNEIYAGLSYNIGYNSPGSKNGYLASTIGYDTSSTTIYPTKQYPQLYDYGFDGLPLALFPDYSSPIFQHKVTPSLGDNLTKVYTTHTVKVGFYLERSENNQTDLNVASNGQIQQYYIGPNTGPGTLYEPDQTQYPTPGNYLASFFLGQIQQFNQFNFQTNSDLYYWTADAFATDSWKVNRKLTMDYGFRLQHLGPWEDAHGIGLAVWDPALYAAQTSVSIGANGDSVITSTSTTPGYNWHARDKSIPNSGAGSTAVFFSPRFGIAYDLYGDGKTFLRGGVGAYRSHDAWNDVNQEQATAQGQTYASVGGGGLRLEDISKLAQEGYAGVASGNGSQSGTSGVGFGLASGDTEQPLTYTYSFTLSQQINNSTLFEMSYQGSQSKYQLTQYEAGSPGDLANVNALPIGALFHPDPITGEVNTPEGFSQENHVNDFRKYPFYTQANVARHILYSNYNGLQTSFRRTQGRFQYSVNHTWSKNLGILGSYATGNVIDSTNLRPNYGPLATDRSQILNATYSYNVGDWKHGSNLVRGIANGWEISGITNLQSGPNVQRSLGSGFNIGGNLDNDTILVNNVTFLGTPDIYLQPRITCDPRTNLVAHEYFNHSCFALPQYGVNGPAELPYIHGPAYFNTDARVGKGFKIGEKKDLQFQLSAFNFINRANYSFSSKFPTQQTLTFSGPSVAAAQPPEDFGFSRYRFGRRVLELSLKYNF
jgi:hypothetical protein